MGGNGVNPAPSGVRSVMRVARAGLRSECRPGPARLDSGRPSWGEGGDFPPGNSDWPGPPGAGRPARPHPARAQGRRCPCWPLRRRSGGQAACPHAAPPLPPPPAASADPCAAPAVARGQAVVLSSRRGFSRRRFGLLHPGGQLGAALRAAAATAAGARLPVRRRRRCCPLVFMDSAGLPPAGLPRSVWRLMHKALPTLKTYCPYFEPTAVGASHLPSCMFVRHRRP